MEERQEEELHAEVQERLQDELQEKGLHKEAHLAMKLRLVTPDSDAPALWHPGGLGRPPTPWEAGNDWGQGRTEQCLAQCRFCRERRRDHAKGDERRRCVACAAEG